MSTHHTLAFGSYRIDLVDERLWRGQEALRLTNKAFAVLRYLVEHRGQLVTKEALLDSVWPDTFVNDAALTVCIRELRQTLGDSARTPQFIETVRGRGYRFIPPVTGVDPAPTQTKDAAAPLDAPAAVVEQPMVRRLAAIFSADVQGYSRLMGEDEAVTVQTLTAYREVLTSFIEQHRGRVVDTPGDNLLAEFASVIDAVQCAVAIQCELAERNAAMPEPRRMRFRIGLNLGDVLVDGERIYGDGVNIAARVESLAGGGGICVSGTVYDQTATKLNLTYTDLGEQTLKNIAKPV
jgi:class 3 adenylate cyclase